MLQTILIVNDEPSQLRIAEFTIRDKLRFSTVTATGGEEAIRCFLRTGIRNRT